VISATAPRISASRSQDWPSAIRACTRPNAVHSHSSAPATRHACTSRAAQARGLHPVAGVQLELATLAGGPATLEELTTPATGPIVLFAESDAGYRNLVRLVTVAHSRAGRGDRSRPAAAVSSHPHGHRGAGRPFITLDDLIQHRSGLIAQSPG